MLSTPNSRITPGVRQSLHTPIFQRVKDLWLTLYYFCTFPSAVLDDCFLQKVIHRALLFAHYFLIEPAGVPASKYNNAIVLFSDKLVSLCQQLFHFYFGNLSLKHRVLNPAKVASAELQHFAYPLFAYIVHQNYIHTVDVFGFVPFISITTTF